MGRMNLSQIWRSPQRRYRRLWPELCPSPLSSADSFDDLKTQQHVQSMGESGHGAGKGDVSGNGEAELRLRGCYPPRQTHADENKDGKHDRLVAIRGFHAWICLAICFWKKK